MLAAPRDGCRTAQCTKQKCMHAATHETGGLEQLEIEAFVQAMYMDMEET